MVFWLVALSALLATTLLIALVPLRLGVSAEARADADGAWAAAGGLSLGPLVLSGVGARGVAPMLHVYLFGRRRYSRALDSGGASEEGAPSEEDANEGAEPPEEKGSERSLVERWLGRRWSALDAATWLFSERRRLRLRLDIEVGYSCRDIALTGRIYAASCLLLPLMPSGVSLRSVPSWDSVDRGNLKAAGELRLFAALVLWDLIWYMLKARFAPRR